MTVSHVVAAGVFAALNRAVELHIIATDPEDDTGVYDGCDPQAGRCDR